MDVQPDSVVGNSDPRQRLVLLPKRGTRDTTSRKTPCPSERFDSKIDFHHNDIITRGFAALRTDRILSDEEACGLVKAEWPTGLFMPEQKC